MSGGLPEVRQEFFPLSGGMDQLTPAIALKSGMVIDACNFEPEINGGYRRRAGYERFDGHASPSSASYYLMPANVLLAGIGQTITGVGSGATAKVIGTYSSGLVLGRLTGSFSASEVYGNVSRASTGTYFNSSGVLSTAGVNVPRVNYNPANLSAAPVLMAEAAATNLLLYSEQFEQPPHGAWQCQPVSTNVAIAPNGTMTADKLIENATTNGHSFNYGMSVTAGVTYNRSVHLKAGERTWAVVGFATNNGAFPWTLVKVNLLTGAITTLVGTPINPVCVDAGGGWWRVGLSCTAIASVLGIFYFGTFNGAEVYLGDGVSGLYAWGEQIEIGSTMTSYIPTTSAAVTRAAETAYAGGVVTSPQTANSANQPSDDADYKLLAANDLRLDISAVPGQGPIRGVWIYNDVVYAFRDNAGGTAGAIYRSSASGWQLVSLGTELQFSSATGGTTPIAVGATIGNAAAPTKTATVLAVVTRTGTWGTDAVGTLIITPVAGSWSSAEAIYVGATQKAVSTAAATAITRLPGGRVECVNANFTSSTNTLKMYGCDGVNTAFEFDGIVYAPIRTGMATDTPSHIMFHRFYLFLSFRGSAQYSAIGNPYAWSVILGAGEIACADDITGFLPQTGNTAGSSMAIFTRTRTYILYGSTAASWNLVVSNFDIGYSAYTMQPVSNNTYGLTARGVQCLLTTLTYGDFDFASISHPVTPFVVQRRGGEIASTSLRTKDQYRLYYNDGYCLVIGLSGDKVSGMMPLNYNRVVRCIVTQTLSTGEEVTYFGSDDGYIYRDNIGTSYDGSAFEYWVRMAFNHSKSPQIRKRYRRAVMEVYAYGYCQVSVTYDLGYSNPNVMTPAAIPSQNLSGGGGYWDQFTWDSFSWDSQLVEQPRISMTGTERNVSFLFYGNRAQDQQFTLQGITLFYTPQRIER